MHTSCVNSDIFTTSVYSKKYSVRNAIVKCSFVTDMQCSYWD